MADPANSEDWQELGDEQPQVHQHVEEEAEPDYTDAPPESEPQESEPQESDAASGHHPGVHALARNFEIGDDEPQEHHHHHPEPQHAHEEQDEQGYPQEAGEEQRSHEEGYPEDHHHQQHHPHEDEAEEHQHQHEHPHHAHEEDGEPHHHEHQQPEDEGEEHHHEHPHHPHEEEGVEHPHEHEHPRHAHEEEGEPHHHEHHHPEEEAREEAQPADQWAEIGDEEPQSEPQDHHQHHEHHQQPHEDAPEEADAAQRGIPDHAAHHAPRQATGKRTIARWEPVEHNPNENSDDEFELSTCMAPVYEGEGEAGQEEASVFKNGEPDCQGEIMSCFDEPNLLYRIIDPKEKTWAFYNDSLNYEMHVQFTFGKHSKLQPLGKTSLRQDDSGSHVAEVIVYPTETEMFVQGSVNGFTSKLRAVPLSDEYHNARRGITEEQVTNEIAAIQQVTESDNAEDVLQACIENGLPFVDPEFPPSQASLDTGATKPFKPLAWARPQACVPEEMAAQVRLFRSNVKPGCVDAGDLGDSWVMCSVAAVSEDPARLMGMFRHPEGKGAALREHAVGAYRVTFNKNGWWRSVLVDSYLPVSAGKLKYAKSAVDPAEIWPAILEKAYAKLHGSYAKICSGDPLHALQDMTGFSSSRFDEELVGEGNKTRSDMLFDDLVRGVSAGFTIICNTPGNDPKSREGKNSQLTSQYAEVGLVTGHAYTILDAKYFEDHNLRIVKVRNAWGRGLEWNGDWSDSDSKWEEYPEVADACGFQKAADGTFWMPWEAAQKYFNGGGVCFSHQPAYDYRMNCVFTNGVPSAVLEIEVAAPTWFTFVISQDDKRCKENAAEYQPVMISIAEPVDGGMYKVVMNSSANGVHPTPDKWTFLQARDISLIHKLDAGKYIVVPRNMPTDGEPVPYVMGIISNKEVGSGDVSVRFKRLDAGNRVFENFPKFEPELREVEQPVQYQKRAPGEGFPMTQLGEELA